MVPATGRPKATTHPSPLVERIDQTLRQMFTHTPLYTRDMELAHASPRARKLIIDEADAILSNLLDKLTELEAAAHCLSTQHPVAVNQELAAVCSAIKAEQAILSAKLQPFRRGTENLLPLLIEDDAGAHPNVHDERTDHEPRAAERALRADLREGDSLSSRDDEVQAVEPVRHLDRAGGMRAVGPKVDAGMNGVAQEPGAGIDQDGQREGEGEAEAEEEDIDRRPAERPRDILQDAARPPNMAHVRAALVGDRFGSIVFGRGSPYVVTGREDDYVLMADVRKHFDLPPRGPIGHDPVRLEQLGVTVLPDQVICRSCKKRWHWSFPPCCDNTRRNSGVKKAFKTLLIGVARRDHVDDDDDDDDDDENDVAELRMDEAGVVPLPAPARASRPLRSQQSQSARRIEYRDREEPMDEDEDEDILSDLSELSDGEGGDDSASGDDDGASSTPPFVPPRPPRTDRDRDMNFIRPVWPPRDAALCNRLLKTQLGSLLLEPDSPFTVTGDERDAVAVEAVRLATGRNGKRGGSLPVRVMAEIGLYRAEHVVCCDTCHQRTAIDRRCCDVWDRKNGKVEKRPCAAVVGLALRTM
ncbi:hypothetical protein GGF31_000659 [Allomyces arbusculus]|nr:hypothetical protein GGF31_000659 [Allomyces arbusculus]